MLLLPAPSAPRRPLRHERFGIGWDDDWAWLRDAGYPKVEDPEILAYLAAENAHFEAALAPHEPLVEKLHAELKARLKPDEASVPVKDGSFEYHWRFTHGAQYRTWLRRPLEPAAQPVVILDEPTLAEGKGYFSLRSLAPSPDGSLLAYSTDEDGSERYHLQVRDLGSGLVIDESVRNMSGGFAWTADGSAILYVELNEQLRPFRVREHRLGTVQEDDRIVYEEADPAFFVSIGRSRDRHWFTITAGTHVTSEVRLLPADHPAGEPRLVAARREGHRYSVDHGNGSFWILTNDRHENFRLVKADPTDTDEEHWQEVLPGDPHRYLLGADCFEGFLVLSLRYDGLARLVIHDYAGSEHEIAFEEPVYTVALGDNREFATDSLRISYSSMVTPASVIDYHVADRRLVTRKVQEVPSGYDPGHYRTRRLMAPSRDGVLVPVTVVHRDDYPLDGSGRLFLYGYGAYGHGLDPAFSPHRLSLLDRGFCFAYAHVRGGDELGWRWYEDGKLLAKDNSFADFEAAAEHLCAEGYGQAGQITIKGGSAGGMLVGAVCNRRPDLWRCAIADVPFVDVLNTMLDASLPLTPIEWPEWGDPLTDEAAFRRILAYSPYDNVRPQPYPAMLVTAGISDPRVTYWEPAKLVARLRATKTGDQPLLFKINMEAGHFGRSGRFEALRELAEQYAFVFACYGMIEAGETA